MIFDEKFELEIIESQPGWVGMNERIAELKKDLQKNVLAFDRNPDKWNQKRIQKSESEIKFFENILLFWSMNYQKMKNISIAVERQMKVVNEGARLLDLINDLKIAHTMEGDTQKILCEKFLELAKSKGVETDKLDLGFKKLRDKINEYWIHMSNGIDKINNE